MKIKQLPHALCVKYVSDSNGKKSHVLSIYCCSFFIGNSWGNVTFPGVCVCVFLSARGLGGGGVTLAGSDSHPGGSCNAYGRPDEVI